MAWRGQGGRRAKGRRGDQGPEADNTAWLAELEREAATADDDEDWASTLRGRRSPAPPQAAPRQPPPSPEPGWAPAADPAPPQAPDHRFLGMERDDARSSSWEVDPAPQDTRAARSPDPDWSTWHPQDRDAFAEPRGGGTETTGWGSPPPAPEEATWRPAGADTPTAAWSPDEPSGHGSTRGWSDEAEEGWAPEQPASREAAGRGWTPEQPAGREASSRGWESAEPGTAGRGWPPEEPTGVDAPTRSWAPEEPDPVEPPSRRWAEEPSGRDPDYPALFGELYRRSAAQLDPIWEAPPVAEPLPDPGQPDPPAAAWPFEETTQSWEPSDRSFIWPSDELPSASAEWDRPAPSWPDEPSPPAPSAETSAWSVPTPPASGVPPPPAATGPPPADWAAAIPTDVPAARRVADPNAATRAWRTDEALEAEPAVPLGTAQAPVAYPAPPDPVEARRPARSAEPRRPRQPDDHRPRAWPRIVAIISWIVLVMVVCWFYVFPWLERVLPENF